jgi:hypothetical protein
MSLIVAVFAALWAVVSLISGDMADFGICFVVAVAAFVIWTGRNKDDNGSGENKKSQSRKTGKMSDDDKWLEENSWVWSDPNYNGRKNGKK